MKTHLQKISRSALVILLVMFSFSGSFAQELLNENFSSITGGDNTTTGGSSTAWTAANTNFPTGGRSNAYQAGGAVRLGSGSGNGYITSKTLDLSTNGGSFTVAFDVKGWTAIEGNIVVSVTGLTNKTVTYTAVRTGSFEGKVVNFTGGTANSTVRIATSAGRAYIDNVVITSVASTNPSISTTGGPLTFSSTNVGSQSGNQQFQVTGTDLTNPISVSASSTNFVVSLTGIDGSFSNGISLPAAGGTVYVRFTPQTGGSLNGTINLTSSPASAVSVAVSGTGVSLDPTFSAGTLASFANTCVGNTTTANSFVLNGSNLTAGNISVGPLNGFEFSTSEFSGYNTSLTMSSPGGSFTQTIYVRFSPTAAVSYNGNIPVNGGGASMNVAAVAMGINTPSTATTVSSSNLTSISATLSGSFTNGCSNVTNYGIEYSVTSGFANGSGTSIAGADAASGAFSVNVSGLSPATTYYYKAFATNGTTTVYGTQLSFTTSAINAPTALLADPINSDSFLARWNAVAGAQSYRLDVSLYENFALVIPTNNLFISEYGEGSTGSKKYIEIYNGTGETVNLANYQVWGIANGGNWPENTLSLSGNLLSGQTYVIANNSGDVIGANLYNAGIMNFNGDDAIGLAWNGGSGSTFTLIDAVGTDGADPGTGWSVAGINNATVDRILVRKPTVMAGNTNWTSSAGTTADNSEWIVSSSTYSATNQTTNLGAHTINNSTPSFLAGYENRIVNGTSELVEGLEENTFYYYRVRAFSTNSTSANSSTITVKTATRPATFGSISQPAAVCDGASMTFNLTGLLPLSENTITYTIGDSGQLTETNITADENGDSSFDLILNASQDGQTLTVTSIERTDMDSDPVATTTFNTVVLDVIAFATYYADQDGDGYGNALISEFACIPSQGFVSNNTDCDDNNIDANPGEAGEILYNGFDDDCSGTIDDGFQITTQNYAQYCGITQAQIYHGIAVNYFIPNVTRYRFRITNLTNPADGSYYIERGYSSFNLTEFAQYHYGTKYSVATMIQRNGIWLGYYGAECEVTTPSVPQLQNCGGTIAARGTLIFSQVKLKITGYQFEVTRLSGASPQGPQVINNGTHYFSFNNVTDYVPGAQYSVRVSVKTTGYYSAFGNACTITGPGQQPASPAKDNVKAATEFTAVAYPNPYGDTFALKLTTSGASTVTVKVYDMVGRIMEVREIAASELDSQQLGTNYPSGVYNIVVTQAEQVKNIRVIKR